MTAREHGEQLMCDGLAALQGLFLKQARFLTAHERDACMHVFRVGNNMMKALHPEAGE